MIAVHISHDVPDVPVDRTRLEALVRTVCGRFGLDRATVSVGIVDDAEMGRLNRQFLGHDGPTDVLSFDLSDGPGPDEGRVFDLLVNGELAAREAARRGHGAEAELALYITHGLLHNLGFSDATAEQAGQMHEAEDEILRSLHYGSVYNSGRRTE